MKCPLLYAQVNTTNSDPLTAAEASLTRSPNLAKREVEQNTTLVPSITDILEKPLSAEQSERHATFDQTDNLTLMNTVTKALTCSNVAIIIPDSLELVSSQQTCQDSNPTVTLSGGGVSLPLSEVMTHGELPPMTRQSTPVETDCHEAATSNRSEEDSPSRTTPASLAH